MSGRIHVTQERLKGLVGKENALVQLALSHLASAR